MNELDATGDPGVLSDLPEVRVSGTVTHERQPHIGHLRDRFDHVVRILFGELTPHGNDADRIVQPIVILLVQISLVQNVVQTS